MTVWKFENYREKVKQKLSKTFGDLTWAPKLWVRSPSWIVNWQRVALSLNTPCCMHHSNGNTAWSGFFYLLEEFSLSEDLLVLHKKMYYILLQF